jgi:DNA repair protein RadC
MGTVKQLKQRTLDELLAPGAGVVQAPKKRGRALPKPAKPGAPYALPVYRCQLVQERTLAVTRLVVTTPSQIASVVWDYLDSPDREVFVVVLLDAANTLLGINTVSVGDVSQTPVGVREVFKPALLRNAERIVIAHNHLNGNVRPSPSDKKLTRALVAAGRVLEIDVCDHVIVGRTPRERFSFLDEGLLPELK